MLDLLRNKILSIATYFSKRRKYLNLAILTDDGKKFLFSIPMKDDKDSANLADCLKKYKHIEIDCSVKDKQY